MRIAIDARSLTEHQPSGIGVYTLHVTRAMVQQAPHHTFVLFTSGAKSTLTPALTQLLQFSNVQHIHINWPNKLLHAATWLGVAPSLEHWLGSVDIVFAPNIHIMPKRQAPLVVTVHDLTYELFSHCLSWRRKLWHRVVHPQRLLQHANHCIAVSESTANDLATVYGIETKDITAIHSAVPVAAKPDPLPGLPREFALVLSTVEPRKNIAATVQAYQRYMADHPESNLELVVIGSSGWKSSKLIHQMQQHPRIHYVGYCTPEQKQYALQHAKLLLYPSVYEGFGFPPLEALREGCPVIASRVGAIPEILNDAAYYVDPYSIASIAEAIHTLYTDTALSSTLVRQANTVMHKLSWSSTAQQTLKVLENSI